jgi:mRNA interferase HigB
MRIIAKRILRDFWKKYPDSAGHFKAWYHEFATSNWESLNQLKAVYRNSSILKGGRVVFNICGNKYRLIGAIKYEQQISYIRFIGTHAEYDKVDAETV